MAEKLWGGRFLKTANPLLEKLNCSIDVDRRLFLEDIVGSQAYANALLKVDLLTENENVAICKGLEQIKNEWNSETFIIKDGDEDIHTANERRLKELIGEPATKLHVGRSRNDQVITDMKLWLRSASQSLLQILRELIFVITERCTEEVDILMPGYTHLQRAQPVRWSHWLLSYAWTLKNDVQKVEDMQQRINIMPLGSGALAGNPFKINREDLAHNLGFSDVTYNSMQAVADRDFVADFLYWASLVGVHLSRLAEDLIIFSTKEFNFLSIDEEFSTGSSLMPQKRNPDSLELIRSIGGSLFGHCSSFMMALKGLPSTYNKDLQLDKVEMFKAFDKLKLILEVTSGVVKTLKVHQKSCRNALDFNMLATDLAYYLVRKGVPFRKAHESAGKVVAFSEAKGISIQNVKLEDLQIISEYFDEDVAKIWNFENSVEQYDVVGGTSKKSVFQQIEALRTWLIEDTY